MQLDIITASMKNALSNLNTTNGDRLITDLSQNCDKAAVKLKSVLHMEKISVEVVPPIVITIVTDHLVVVMDVTVQCN